MSKREQQGTVRVKRVYEAPEPAKDGARVLVDRVWPRGVAKADAALDAWEKEVAPSSELRKWYGHDPERWEEFRRRYREELQERPEPAEALERLRDRAADGTVTLLTAVKAEDKGHVRVLEELLKHRR